MHCYKYFVFVFLVMVLLNSTGLAMPIEEFEAEEFALTDEVS